MFEDKRFEDNDKKYRGNFNLLRCGMWNKMEIELRCRSLNQIQSQEDEDAGLSPIALSKEFIFHFRSLVTVIRHHGSAKFVMELPAELKERWGYFHNNTEEIEEAKEVIQELFCGRSLDIFKSYFNSYVGVRDDYEFLMRLETQQCYLPLNEAYSKSISQLYYLLDCMAIPDFDRCCLMLLNGGFTEQTI